MDREIIFVLLLMSIWGNVFALIVSDSKHNWIWFLIRLVIIVLVFSLWVL